MNFSEVRSDSLRYGVIFFKQFGPRGRPGGFGGRGRPGARPQATSGRAANSNRGGGPSDNAAQGNRSQPATNNQQTGTQPAEEAANTAQTNTAGTATQPQGENGQAQGRSPTNQNAAAGRQPRRGFFGSQPGRGRWNISAFHRIRFTETVLIAPGVPTLDLLNGSSVGGAAGAIRHSVELQGGWFKDGLGFRVSGDFQGPSNVDGGGINAASPTLDFGAIATFNLRAFLNFDNREKIVSALPFLRGSRLALRVNNVFDAQQDVRDQDGNVPLQFQPGFRDPIGRFVELSWRKRF